MLFNFIIPLKSREASRDWERVVKFFTATLHSIMNSTCQDFRILVACHDVPKTPYNESDKIVFLKAPFPPHMGCRKYRLDKLCKLRLGALEVRKLGGGYLMPMDADDLISKNLVEYALKSEHPHGYIINKGYELDYRQQRVRHCPRYHLICGSSIIMKVDKFDLPDSLIIEQERGTTYFDRMIYPSHRLSEQVSGEFKRPLEFVPFRAGVYVIDTGENISQQRQTRNVGIRRKLVRLICAKRKMNDRIIDEFGVSLV